MASTLKLGLIALSTSACVHFAERRPDGENVEIIIAERPGCKVLGEVVGKSARYIFELDKAVKSARSDLRIEAAELGATHVLLETNNSSRDGDFEVVLGGKALRCEVQAIE